MKDYNLFEIYIFQHLRLFPFSFPLNYDSKTDTVSMWVDLYPMLFMYVLRKFKQYFSDRWHFMWYPKYRQTSMVSYDEQFPFLYNMNADGFEHENEMKEYQAPFNADYDLDEQRILEEKEARELAFALSESLKDS